jgi:penicillin-binding protein 2
MKRFRRPDQQKWYAGETISIGIGQGYNAYTPMQIALAMATLAANGDMYRPRLVSHIDNVRTGARRHLEPVLQQRLALKPENVEFVKRAMAGVNTEGTGARAFGNAQYSSGGKTGTSQVIGMKQGETYDEKKVAERHRDHSLFIVFAPVESPRIALMVIVENGGFGARAAAPIARTVLDYYLLGKVPEAAPGAAALAGEDEEEAESD